MSLCAHTREGKEKQGLLSSKQAKELRVCFLLTFAEANHRCLMIWGSATRTEFQKLRVPADELMVAAVPPLPYSIARHNYYASQVMCRQRVVPDDTDVKTRQ